MPALDTGTWNGAAAAQIDQHNRKFEKVKCARAQLKMGADRVRARMSPGGTKGQRLAEGLDSLGERDLEGSEKLSFLVHYLLALQCYRSLITYKDVICGYLKIYCLWVKKEHFAHRISRKENK